jgi:hypothetical protein
MIGTLAQFCAFDKYRLIKRVRIAPLGTVVSAKPMRPQGDP